MDIEFICTKTRTNLLPTAKLAIFCRLMGLATNYHLPRGAIMHMAAEQNVDRRVIANIWKVGAELVKAGKAPDFMSKKVNCGRRPMDECLVRAAIRGVPLNERHCLRSIAAKANVTVSVLRRLLQSSVLRLTKNHVKPRLTPANMAARLQFCRSFVHPTPTGKFAFSSMCNVVHIDEKWFNLCEVNQKIYLLDDEEEPVRPVQHKNHIMKVMFICAVARPRGGFDGKVLEMD